MKKPLYISLVLVAVFVAWLYLTKKAPQKSSSPEQTNKVAQSLPSSKTNPATIISNPPAAQIVLQTTNIIQLIASLTNALTATNIEQWKAAIKGLHKSPGLSESWDMEITNRTSGIIVPLVANGQTNFYKARFINIDVYQGSDGKIMEVQMHSPIMNIDETRELGLQLCNLLQIDPKGFLAWCGKVGNRWMDQPLFGDGDGHHYSFHLLQTFDNEKPWYINFMIIPNP
jgi:hypothetical protein